MTGVVIFLVTAICLCVMAWFLMHRRQRTRINNLDAAVESNPLTGFGCVSSAIDLDELPGFGEHLVTIANFLPRDMLVSLRDGFTETSAAERSYFPGHKSGGTLSYESLLASVPAAVSLYRSEQLQEVISKVVGEPVLCTPVWDQSSCSLLIYDRAGDHIGWHRDHNFYQGRHFTVLMILVNDGPNGQSSSMLQVKRNNQVIDIPTPENTLVIFEGCHVMHRVTRLKHNEQRYVLSMTFATNIRNSLYQAVMRRIKDTAYYGIRALWT